MCQAVWHEYPYPVVADWFAHLSLQRHRLHDTGLSLSRLRDDWWTRHIEMYVTSKSTYLVNHHNVQ